jgi:uncharacterized protein Smg (DUF494 family)
MSDERAGDPVVRLLRLLAERLEAYLDGDELAFETLGERLEEEGCTGDDLQAAAMVLRSLVGEPPAGGEADLENAPGEHAQRVPSAEERASLSPEAWGYLIELRRRGSLSAAQFEQVMERLTDFAVRPVDVETAREVATRIALKFDDLEHGGPLHGDGERAN